MKGKSTPGPWRVTSTCPELAPEALDVDDLKGRCIAQISQGRLTREEAQYNAHLIASAPELLEACILAEKYTLPDNALGVIRKAIAKAEGRE